MAFLIDTNLLLRSTQPNHPMYVDTVNALDALRKQGEQFYLVAQNLMEFWVVATRPITQNGLGMSARQAAKEIERLKTLFVVLPDTPDIFPEWEQLVINNQVIGKQAHDARIVAAMAVHGIKNLLTFNAGDFKRYTGINAVDPRSVAANP